jgi:hypothetical protein
MDLVLLLITLIAGTLLIRWWPALRFVASFKAPLGGVLKDTEFNYAQVRLLPRWKPATLLNEGAALQATDPLGHRYLVVISESREDFDEFLDVGEHARLTLDRLIGSLQVLRFEGPQSTRVGGFPAVQYEIEGYHERTCVTYLHTTVAGDRAFHQVIAWATRSKYDRKVFEDLLDGFSEVPGPPARPRPRRHGPTPPETPSRSRYDVH